MTDYGIYTVVGYDRDGKRRWDVAMRATGIAHAELVAGRHPLRPRGIVRLRAVEFEKTIAFRRMVREGVIREVKGGAV